jgi:hypothetical protein
MGGAITKSFSFRRGSTSSTRIKQAEDSSKKQSQSAPDLSAVLGDVRSPTVPGTEMKMEPTDAPAANKPDTDLKIVSPTPKETAKPVNNLSKNVSLELDGVDWSNEAAKRRRNLVMGSMPNVRANMELVRSPVSSNPFPRLASSAEDDSVGAIRTRVMNSSFVRRNSASGSGSGFLRPKTSDRRKSLPSSMSMTMPAKAMKQVSMSEAFVF